MIAGTPSDLTGSVPDLISDTSLASSKSGATENLEVPDLPEIEDAAAHRKALERIDILWNAEQGTPGGREFEALVAAVVRYEDRHFPIPPIPDDLSPEESVLIVETGLEIPPDILDWLSLKGPRPSSADAFFENARALAASK